MDAAKMTRDQLKKVIASARKTKFDPSPYKNMQKGLNAFKDSAKQLAAVVKQNPDA